MERKYEDLRDRVIEDVKYALSLIDEEKIAGGKVILTGLVDSLKNEKEIESNASATNENI